MGKAGDGESGCLEAKEKVPETDGTGSHPVENLQLWERKFHVL